MNKFKCFWDYYIKGEYHCDTCPFCWEERGYEDADAGCYIKGELHDTCRLLPPFRFLVGWARRKKTLYHINHEYDDYPEWVEEEQRKDSAVKEILNNYFNDKEEVSTAMIDIRYKLEGALSTYKKYEPLKTRWKNLIKDTWRRFLMVFKPYFCK